LNRQAEHHHDHRGHFYDGCQRFAVKWLLIAHYRVPFDLSLGLAAETHAWGAQRELHFAHESLRFGISELVVHFAHRPDALMTHPGIDNWLWDPAVHRERFEEVPP
jgi:hypothetical protein